MNVVDTPVDQLRPDPRNPRYITDTRYEQLKRALVADPEMTRARPVIALPDGTVIAGNMRLRAAIDLGWKTIPAITVDLDPQRAREWQLRDNQGYGEWDEALLAEMMAEMAASGSDLDLTGFGQDDVDRILQSAGIDPENPAAVGGRLSAIDMGVGDPTHVAPPGSVWDVGPHVLVVASVFTMHQVWAPLLDDASLFVPYPTPATPLGLWSEERRCVFVQPDAWLAGHLLDKYASVHGDHAVRAR